MNRWGEVPVVELLTDRPRVATGAFRSEVVRVELEKSLWDALQRLSVHVGCTLDVALLAAFQVLLHRYTGQDEIAVRVVSSTGGQAVGVAGRQVYSAICADFSGELSFVEVVAQMQEVAFAGNESGQIGRVVFAGVLSGEFVGADCQVPAVEWHSDERHELVGAYDLFVAVDPQATQVAFYFNAELFDVATIERMSGHFYTLL
ncbi:MAG: condensation domain-containing protein, partial [Tumebacillaceae bacterium]